MRPLSLWYLLAFLGIALLWLVPSPPLESATVPGLATTAIQYGEFLPARLTAPGEVQEFVFQGQPGQVVTLILENQTSGALGLILFGPDNQPLASSTGDGDRELVNVGLSIPGAYTIRVDAPGDAVGDYALGLFSNAGLSVLAPTAIKAGQVVAHQFAAAGGYTLFSINGATNEILTLFVDNRLNGGLEVRLFSPDGRQIGHLRKTVTGDDLLLEHQLLPVGGTYLLLVNPTGSSTGDVTVAVYTGLGYDRIGLSGIGAGQGQVGSLALGEQALLRFAGAAGQRIVVDGDHWRGHRFYLRLFDPRGGQLAAELAPSGDGTASLEATLPEDGDYLVVFDPYHDAVGDYTVTLFSATERVEPPPPLIRFGESRSGSVEGTGRSALHAFDATANQEVTLAVNNGLNGGLTVRLISPSGEVVGSAESVATGDDLLLNALTREAGRYLVALTPRHGAVGSYRLVLYGRPGETDGGTPVSYGETVTGSASGPGEHALYRFDGRAGQLVSVSGDNALDGGFVLRLFDPNGQLLAIDRTEAGGEHATLENVLLPMDGAYLTAVDPLHGATGDWDLTVYNTASTSALAPEPISYGATAIGSIDAPGRQAFYRFSGAAGDAISVTLGSAIQGKVQVRLIAPTGQQLAAEVTTTAASDLTLGKITLPLVGEYLVIVDPLHDATGSFSLGLRQDETSNVSSSPSDYWVATSPVRHRAARGQSVSYAIALAPRDSYSGPVTVQFDPTSTPPNASIFLDENTVALPGTVTLSVYVGAATPRGDHTLRLIVTSGSSRRVVPLELHVLGGLDWVVTPPITQVAAGQAVSYQGALAHADGGSGTVIFTVDPATMPPNASSAFHPTVQSQGDGQIGIKIRTTPTTPVGDYTLKLRATVDSSLQSITPVVLRVRPLTTSTGQLVFLPLLQR